MEAFKSYDGLDFQILEKSEMQNLRKIVIVNTVDEGGGAERVSMATLGGFLSLGLDTWLLVGRKAGRHPRVVSFYESPFFDYGPYADARVQRKTERQRRDDISRGIEDFNHPYSHRIAEMTGSPPDLVLCHNLHGGYFDLRVLAELSHCTPVALRLCDPWLQTGHCAYPLGCERWQHGCGECPDLTIPPAISRDATRENFRRKQRIFRASRLFVSAESQWMIERGKRSTLAAAAVSWTHILGGVDLETFRPGDRQAARQRLGLDPDARLLLYVAHQGSVNPYKDFATVRKAMAQLAQQPDRRAVLLVVGSAAPDELLAPDVLIRHAGEVQSRSQLADFYRAADMLVHSAIEEAFGYVVAEALACGTPVVTASIGGTVELIDEGRTGLVVPPREPDRLAHAMAQLLDNPALRAEMGDAAAATARRNLDGRILIHALRSWCEEVHAAWHAEKAR
jgi:glycosyltransferase involved in cell wall biosynthesis